MHSTLTRGTAAGMLWLIAAALATAQGTPGRSGIVISEVHHASRGDGLPTYIELVNLDPGQPIPLNGAVITVSGPGAASQQITLQGGSIPAYNPTTNAAGVATPGTGTIVLVDPAGPIIPNIIEQVLPAPALFVTPGLLDPAFPWTVCLSVPGSGPTAIPFVDRVDLNGGVAATTCPMTSAPLVGNLPYMGSLVRGYRVDSGTFLDFISLPGPTQVLPPDPPYQGPPVAPSPSVVNPEMSRVTGFFFGSPNNGPGDPGVPFATPPVVAPGTTAGTVSGFNSTANAVTATVSVSGTGLVAWIEFGDHPYSSARRQADPIFDPIIPNGQLNVQTTLRGRDPFLGHEPFPAPTPVALGEMFRLTRPDPLAPGILTIDMGPMEQVDLGFRLFRPGPTAASQRVRIERVLSDQTTDGTASGTGNLTQVQIDILPSEGDIWCELIIYDGNGFSYRAKVRNWPPNPFNCTTPTLGLGSNAPGNLDIIALCFDTEAALYCLPSFSTSNPTGSGPFFGLVPDPTTFTYLSLPFGSHPAFVQTTVDGLYFLSITDPGLTGFTFDMVSIQWGGANLTGSGFTQFSNVATIVVQ